MSERRRELFVADTSYISARDRPAARAWPSEIVGRLHNAVLGLSVVTIADAELDVAERRDGRTFSDNDLWIAATAQTLGVPLVTCDRAFQRMEHLDVEVVYLPSRAPVEVIGAGR